MKDDPVIAAVPVVAMRPPVTGTDVKLDVSAAEPARSGEDGIPEVRSAVIVPPARINYAERFSRRGYVPGSSVQLLPDTHHPGLRNTGAKRLCTGRGHVAILHVIV